MIQPVALAEKVDPAIELHIKMDGKMPHGSALVMGYFMKRRNQHNGSGSQPDGFIRIGERGLFTVFQNADQAVARKPALPFS